MRTLLAACIGGLTSIGVSTVIPAEPAVMHGQGLADKKDTEASSPVAAPLLATLVQVHTAELVILDSREPTNARFSALLGDRATGESATLDPRLLELLRRLAEQHRGARIELVSGYRSPKLNEMLRKKGHHVASHSQHSLGHAVDFRVLPPGAERGLDPHEVERAIRALGWDGGVGPYEKDEDWFVHADVGPQRRWEGQ